MNNALRIIISVALALTIFSKFAESQTVLPSNFVVELDQYLREKTLADPDSERKRLGEFLSRLSIPEPTPALCREMNDAFSQRLGANENNPRFWFFQWFVDMSCNKDLEKAEPKIRRAIQLDPVYQAVYDSFQSDMKRGKLKGTMSLMTTIGLAVEAYAVDTNTYPREVNGNIQNIVSKIEPTYIKQFPLKDAWGNLFKYYSADRETYWVISFGADGKAESGIYNANGFPGQNAAGETTGPDADLIYRTGEFIRAPRFESKAPSPDVEIKDPVLRAIKEMRFIATSAEAYAVDHNAYPASSTGDVSGLVSLVQPKYIRVLPIMDGWSHPYRYITDAQKQRYWVICTGADGKLDSGIYDSNGIPTKSAEGTTKNPNDDIIFSIGSFLRYPNNVQLQ